MRIPLQVATGYFLIVGLAGWFVLDVFVEEVKPGVRNTMEDTLVDSANLIAELVAPTTWVPDEQPVCPPIITDAFAAYDRRSVDAESGSIASSAWTCGSMLRIPAAASSAPPIPTRSAETIPAGTTFGEPWPVDTAPARPGPYRRIPAPRSCTWRRRCWTASGSSA